MEDGQLQDRRVLPKSLGSLGRNGKSLKSGGSGTSDKYISNQSRLSVKPGWEGYIYPTLGLQGAQCGRENGRVGNSRNQISKARGKAGSKPKNSGVLLQGIECEPSAVR